MPTYTIDRPGPREVFEAPSHHAAWRYLHGMLSSRGPWELEARDADGAVIVASLYGPSSIVDARGRTWEHPSLPLTL